MPLPTLCAAWPCKIHGTPHARFGERHAQESAFSVSATAALNASGRSIDKPAF
jgi:hypothetical protein